MTRVFRLPWRANHPSRPANQNPNSRRLRIEPLEDRRLLANVTVGNLNDVVNGNTASIAALVANNGGDGISLREAVLAANADNTDTSDAISFAPAVTGTIQLTNVGHVGEIAITNGLAINGPGAGVVTVRAFDSSAAVGNGARIFNINNFFFSTPTVAISGLTLTGGDVASGYGGGAILNRENLTITGCTISGNRASDRGGGITNISGGNLSVIASTISGNTSNFHGGGIYSKYGSLTVAQSTISGNAAGSSNVGGGIHSFSSPTTIDSSTISGNSAGAAGGIWSENAGITITSSTISGNSARAIGGGIAASGGILTMRHSTVTLNRSDSDNSGGENGGGMSVSAGSVVEHTIVAGNLRSTSTRDDINGTLTARFSLIGDNTNATITDNGGNQIGTAASPIDPLLGPLANSGGPTMTHALMFGSPAVDTGDPAAVSGVSNVPLVDQRGSPFVRIADGNGDSTTRIDIGAFELKLPGLASFVVDTLVDELDGNYDPGDFSLREAIALANVLPGFGGLIQFAPALVSSGPATILLTQGELTITDSLTIDGPGANLLALDASGTLGDRRVLVIDDGSATTSIAVELAGLTFKGGLVNNFSKLSAGIVNRETLRLLRCTVASNGTAGFQFEFGVSFGAGIFNQGNLTITESTISGNGGSWAGNVAGGICNVNGTLTIHGSTISNNAGENGAGGILNLNGTLTVLNSTISGNFGIGISNGGANYGFDYGSVTVRHSTITGNFAEGNAAFGVGLRDPNGAVLDHTIVAGNIRDSSSGDVADDFFGPLLAIHTLIGFGVEFLGPLADNGGPTFTHALLPGSPAIDAGDPNAGAGLGTVPQDDQRGAPFGRVFDGDGAGGSRIDIGAYERQSLASSFFVVDTLVDEADLDYAAGDRSLREVIALSNGSAGAETISFAAALTSGGPATTVLSLGQLEVRDSVTIDGPGADRLTIDASGNDPGSIFRIFDSTSVAIVSINGLTLTGAELPAISNSEMLSISGVTLTGNNLGILSDGTLTIHNSTIRENLNGGVWNRVGNLTITGSTISGNSGAHSGGGIEIDGGDAVISGSTINGNSAKQSGGGIYIVNFASLTVIDSTISENTSDFNGGGIYISGSSTSLTLKHSTITGNRADANLNSPSPQGGGIFIESSTISLDHTIVAGNIVALNTRDDVFGTATARFSLIGDNTDATITNNGGNLIGTGASPIDPLIGPLADNGGPTLTHALLPGSPAIDAGDPAAVAGVGGVPQFDQRGFAFSRVVNGRIDIGAFEIQASSPSSDFDGDGDVDGRDFLAWQRGESPTPFSSNDLADWQEEYGEGGLSAVSDQLLASQESSAESSPRRIFDRVPEFGSRLLTLASPLTSELIDAALALEQLSATTEDDLLVEDEELLLHLFETISIDRFELFTRRARRPLADSPASFYRPSLLTSDNELYERAVDALFASRFE